MGRALKPTVEVPKKVSAKKVSAKKIKAEKVPKVKSEKVAKVKSILKKVKKPRTKAVSVEA